MAWDSWDYQRAWLSRAAVRMVRTPLDVCSSLTLCWFSLRVVETRSVKAVKSHLNTREGHHTPEGGLKATMLTLVYVVNQNGQKLMPCKPAKARKLLRAGKARVAGRSPFTIKLLWDCEERVQEITLGVDKGSHATGFSWSVRDKSSCRACSDTAWMLKRKWRRVAYTGGAGALGSGIAPNAFSIALPANAVGACRLPSGQTWKR